MLLSDQHCIIFNCELLPASTVLPCPAHNHVFNEQSATKFSSLFGQYGFPDLSNTNDWVDFFNSLCSSTLDLIALLKTISTLKTRKQRWVHDRILIGSCKRKFRKAERSRKKSGLQVHFAEMKELLPLLNKIVKGAKTCYFYELISAHQNDPGFLFKSVNQLVNPSLQTPNDAVCKKLVLHFSRKVDSIRQNITPIRPLQMSFTCARIPWAVFLPLLCLNFWK